MKNNASTLFLGANVIKLQGQYLHVPFLLEEQGSENVVHCPLSFHLSPLSLPPEYQMINLVHEEDAVPACSSVSITQWKSVFFFNTW